MMADESKLQPKVNCVS